MKEKFIAEITAKYTFSEPCILLGGAMIDGEAQPNTWIQIPLKTMNRHGLIAGATGTGKTKTLQILAEQLALNGVSSLLMDIKGDLSGIAAPGTTNPKIEQRHGILGIPFSPSGNTVELLSLSDQPGVKLRATVTEFGPVLFSKILDLNDNQTGTVGVVFKYCDDNNLPLLDLEDFKKTLQFISAEGKADFEKEYGKISTVSVGTILRKVIALEQQGADRFFGEPSFEVDDLCRVDKQGKGIISIVRLTDMQDRPQLFSTFMMSLLAEIYSSFPEEGDLEQPKLVLFIDEAHLVFNNATKVLLDQIETMIKLIRSKGVGVFFCTQSPTDIPESVLGQLGLKIQHALRAFTAKDRKDIKLAAQNFPESAYYNTEDLLTAMGIGEAFVTGLNPKGIPTPLAHTYLRAPQSRMDVLTESEIDDIIEASTLIKKYNRTINRESAYELLQEKIEDAGGEEQRTKVEGNRSRETGVRREKSTWEEIAGHSVTKQIGRTVARELTRGLLGVLGLGGSSRRRKR